jgi:acetylornithine deacetylase/succinyl-diaminopimelate desuccinylase-like protein
MTPELQSPSEKIAPTAAYKAIQLLKQLISTPSFSKEEEKTADYIQSFLEAHGVQTLRKKK